MPLKFSLLLITALFLVTTGTRAATSPDDETDTLLARVFSYTARTGLRIGTFRSEVYARHYLRTRRRGILMRYLPGMFRLERGENEYLGEKLSRYSVHPASGIDRKCVADYSTMPYLRDEGDEWTNRFNLSIYEPGLFTDRILSPLNRMNRRYYRYRAETDYVIGGRRYVSVAVHPAIHNTQLVQGFFDVDAASGAVRLFSFDFVYGWSRLHASGELGTEGRATLLPRRIRIASHTRLLGNRVDETYDATAAYHWPAAEHKGKGESEKDTCQDPYDLTKQCRLRTDTTRCLRTRAAFDTLRPYPLMPAEAAVYHRHDSLHTSRTDTVHRSSWLSTRAEDFLFDSHRLDLGRQTDLRLPPLLTPAMMQWSGSRGLSVQTRLALGYRFFDRFTLNLRPRAGYNFKERQIYWNVPIQMTVMPRLDGMIDIEGGGGDRMYNSAQADELYRRLSGVTGYDSLISALSRYPLHYYRDTHVRAEFSLQPIVGLRIAAGARFHHRHLIGWNALADRAGMHRALVSIAPRLHIDYTPALYYYRAGRRPVPLSSRWPTFMLDYERGVGGQATRYERIETDVRYRLPLHALRSLYFRLGGGLYTLRERNCFLDYDYFRRSYLPESWEDEMAGRFQLLDSRLYNESRHYVRLTASYESPMLLFSRLRLLTRVVQKEHIYANLLNVRRLPLYSEWGYGISTPLIDLAAFVSLADRHHTGFGGKVVLNL